MRCRSAIPVLLVLASATTLAGQAPTGAFVGHIRSTLDSVPIRLADVRLFFIDSTRDVTLPSGAKTLDTFVDTARSRLAATDSTGFFAIWRLAPGHYLMQTRRIGFSPIEAFVTIDTQTVLHNFVMDPLAAMLNRVEIREFSATSLAKRLERVGFMDRKKWRGEGAATFLMPGDWERTKPQTLRDILSREGIFNSNVDIVMDWMSLDYYDVQDYPAILVAAVEIYRRNRPNEFNGTTAGPGVLSQTSGIRKPLVVIWTHIP